MNYHVNQWAERKRTYCDGVSYSKNMADQWGGGEGGRELFVVAAEWDVEGEDTWGEWVSAVLESG